MYSQGVGRVGGVGGVWRLDLATMRWEPMSALVTARSYPACRAVRGTLVVLGGTPAAGGPHTRTSSVEMLSSEEGGRLRRPCTTRGRASHAGLSPDASSSPVGLVSNQLNCTTRSSIGGCGSRATCLTKLD
jgi:hypothetical protein